MPLHPGPWLPSPGTRTSSPVNATSVVRAAYEGFDTDFPTLCGVPFSGVVGSPFTVKIAALSDGRYQLDQAQAEWDLTGDLDLLLLGAFTPTLPPHAVDWEWDLSPEPAGHGRIHWVDSIEITATLTDPGAFSTPVDMTVDLVPLPPSALTYFPLGNVNYPFAHSQPTADTALTPVIASGALPVGTGTATLDATLTDFTYLSGLTDPDASVVLTTILAPDAQRTHTAPPAVTDREAVASDLHAVFHFTLPRYRFLYSVLPRLRQFPRDDFLGGAPRQGHGSTSVQASARQGWRGTYR